MTALWRSRLDQVLKDRYAGVPCVKFPEDMRVYEHLLWESAADTVIEVGTFCGGGAVWFRDRLRTMMAHGRIARAQVISIDLDLSLAHQHLGAALSEGIELVECDVLDPDLPERIRRLLPDGARCLVSDDGGHTYETTQAALKALAGLVPVGGFFVAEDGVIDVDRLRVSESWPRGVRPAVRDWLASEEGERFALRRDLEMYGLTCHVGGYLQRVVASSSTNSPSPPA